MKRVHWILPAQADFASVDDRYAMIDPDYADRVGDPAIDAAETLLAWPGSGSDLPDGTQKWPVSGTPYRLIYRVVPSGIEVLRVRHAAEDWARDL